MVPKVYYARFTTLLTFVRTSFVKLERNLSASCSSSLKNTICKASLPQCSADRTTVTFPDYSAGCSNSLSCAVATTTLHINANFQTMLCGQSGRTYSLTRCQSASVTTYNSDICGNLPSNIKFPEWMVPLIPLQSSNIDTFKQRLMNISATDSCIKNWMKVSCNSIPYCTADSSKIVGVATTQSCQAALNWYVK